MKGCIFPIPGIAVDLHRASWPINNSSMNTWAHADWHTLALVILCQTCGTLAAWYTAPSTCVHLAAPVLLQVST